VHVLEVDGRHRRPHSNRFRALGGPVLLAAALLPSCGDCWSGQITTTCAVTGAVSGVSADGTTYTNQAGGEASCPSAASLRDPSKTGGARDPITAPADLTVALRFGVLWSNGVASSVQLELVVHDVALGPSEIALDDARATLAGWSGLQGHASIATLSQDCSHGKYSCLIALHATVTLAATNAFGDSVSLTGATVDVSETYARQKIMCAQVGE
jgi:hypothetical protein